MAFPGLGHDERTFGCTPEVTVDRNVLAVTLHQGVLQRDGAEVVEVSTPERAVEIDPIQGRGKGLRTDPYPGHGVERAKVARL
jgi:hypothetical protein